MNNREIAEKLKHLVKEERRITNEVLQLINLAQSKKSYLELGYPSMFEWLVKGFGYSNAAAFRRLEAAKLFKVVPSVEEKLAKGELNLSTLSKAQSMLRAQEKISGRKISIEEKTDIVKQIENKSAVETERFLISLFPDLKEESREKQTVIDENTTRHVVNFDKEMSANLKRAKEVVSHQCPNGTDAEVIAYALKFLIKKLDPLTQLTSASEAKRLNNRKLVLRTTNASCSYKDPFTGQVCGSRYQIQNDHIFPKAWGGSNEIENLRPLCRSHNLYMAERYFGKRE